MQYIQKSSKNVNELVESIQKVAPNHKFGVLSVRDMKETLGNKGFDLEEQCMIIDICNPGVAHTLLTKDPHLASVLPCKISVCSQSGQTIVMMSLLTQLIEDINPSFKELASTTQATLQKIIDEAI